MSASSAAVNLCVEKTTSTTTINHDELPSDELIALALSDSYQNLKQKDTQKINASKNNKTSENIIILLPSFFKTVLSDEVLATSSLIDNNKHLLITMEAQKHLNEIVTNVSGQGDFDFKTIQFTNYTIIYDPKTYEIKTKDGSIEKKECKDVYEPSLKTCLKNDKQDEDIHKKFLEKSGNINYETENKTSSAKYLSLVRQQRQYGYEQWLSLRRARKGPFDRQVGLIVPSAKWMYKQMLVAKYKKRRFVVMPLDFSNKECENGHSGAIICDLLNRQVCIYDPNGDIDYIFHMKGYHDDKFCETQIYNVLQAYIDDIKAAAALSASSSASVSASASSTAFNFKILKCKQWNPSGAVLNKSGLLFSGHCVILSILFLHCLCVSKNHSIETLYKEFSRLEKNMFEYVISVYSDLVLKMFPDLLPNDIVLD